MIFASSSQRLPSLASIIIAATTIYHVVHRQSRDFVKKLYMSALFQLFFYLILTFFFDKSHFTVFLEQIYEEILQLWGKRKSLKKNIFNQIMQTRVVVAVIICSVKGSNRCGGVWTIVDIFISSNYGELICVVFG